MHFVEGKKTYTNNIPTVSATRSKPRKSPTVRVTVLNLNTPQCSSSETSRAVRDYADTSTSAVISEINYTSTVVETINKLKEKMAILETEKLQLQKQHEEGIEKVQLSEFQLERFISSDSDFRLYTGFPNYSSFKAFYDHLSRACA
jgi:hypothetical protein